MRGLQFVLAGLSGGRLHHDGRGGYGFEAGDVGRADEGRGVRDADADADAIAPAAQKLLNLANKHGKVNRGIHFDPNHLTVRDVLVIVPLALVLLGVGVAFAFLVSDEVYVKWGGLGLNSAVLFAFFVFNSREFLNKRRFRLFALSFFAIHLIAWIVLLSQIDTWKLAGFGVMVLEVPVFFYKRDWPDRTSS